MLQGHYDDPFKSQFNCTNHFPHNPFYRLQIDHQKQIKFNIILIETCLSLCPIGADQTSSVFHRGPIGYSGYQWLSS